MNYLYETMNYLYETDTSQKIFVMNMDESGAFVWSVEKLDGDSLVLGDGEKRLRFRRKF
jgi:hypothetical protein